MEHRVRIGRAGTAMLAGALIAMGATAAAWAQAIADGTLAAAIRSSGNPCDRVIESSNEGPGQWKVHCNSGWFLVSRNADATLAVTPLD